MSQRDLVYVGHMLDMARKAVGKTQGLSRAQYDADEQVWIFNSGTTNSVTLTAT